MCFSCKFVEKCRVNNFRHNQNTRRTQTGGRYRPKEVFDTYQQNDRFQSKSLLVVTINFLICCKSIEDFLGLPESAAPRPRNFQPNKTKSPAGFYDCDFTLFNLFLHFRTIAEKPDYYEYCLDNFQLKLLLTTLSKCGLCTC